MMTIASAKKNDGNHGRAPFHQWSGLVHRKLYNEWQPVFLRITKSELKCYQNEVSYFCAFMAFVSDSI